MRGKSMHFMGKIKENKLFAAILLLEVIFIVILLTRIGGEARTVTMNAEEWKASSDLEVQDYEDGTRGVCEIESTGKIDEEVMVSKEHELTPGAYKVTVNYKSCYNMSEPTHSVKDSAGKLVLFSYKNGSALSTSTITLDDGATTRTSRLWVRWGKSVEDLRGRILYNGMGQMTIENVILEEVTVWRTVRIFGFLFLCIFLDMIYLFFSKNTILGAKWTLKRKYEVCGLGLIMIMTSMLFCNSSLYYGHDLTFHLERIRALAEAFADGQIPHRIQQSMLNGYGYVNSLFYGELFLSLPALLYNLYVPLQTCYKIYAIVLNVATCLITYHCFTKMSKDWKIGLFTTFLYTASAYRMVDIFVRADVGEYTAMTFLPLVLYGFWKVYEREEHEKIGIRDYLPIVLGLSGIIESHVLTCYMLMVFIPLALLILWKKTFRWNRLWAFVKSVILVALLNLWFIVPLLESMQMNIRVTETGSMGNIEKYGITLSQMFGIFHTAIGDSIWDGTMHEMPLTVGIGLMLAVILFFYACIHREAWMLSENRDFTTAKLGIVLSLTALYFASAYCPWDSLAAVNKDVSQILGTIQFSWRYLEIATIALTLVMIFMMKVILERWGRQTVDRLMLGILAVVLLTEGLFFMEYPDQITSKKYYAESELTGFDVGSGMEYLLIDTDTEELNTNAIETSDGVKTKELVRQKQEQQILCKNEEKEEGYVDVPILYYEHYQAYDQETGKVLELDTGDNNRIRVVLPREYLGTVVITYQEPQHWKILETISLVTFFAMVGYVIVRGKRHV